MLPQPLSNRDLSMSFYPAVGGTLCKERVFLMVRTLLGLLTVEKGVWNSEFRVFKQHKKNTTLKLYLKAFT